MKRQARVYPYEASDVDAKAERTMTTLERAGWLRSHDQLNEYYIKGGILQQLRKRERDKRNFIRNGTKYFNYFSNAWDPWSPKRSSPSEIINNILATKPSSLRATAQTPSLPSRAPCEVFEQ
jgi:hypothetical protein